MRSGDSTFTPPSPGDVLKENILSESGITQEQFAKAMGVSRFSVNQIINGRRSITAEMALRIARVTSTSPEFWLSLQQEVDLSAARAKISDVLGSLPVLRPEMTDQELFEDRD